MISRQRHTFGPLLGYHGCDRAVAERVLAHCDDLRPSENKHDWLGGLMAYDSVLGVFEEGAKIYPGAGLREKTHMQIAICNPQMIVGYFRARGFP